MFYDRHKHFRDPFERLLVDSEDLSLNFPLWAFGEGYKDMDSMACMNAWNERHSDKYLLHENSKVQIDAKYMVELWEKERQQDN